MAYAFVAGTNKGGGADSVTTDAIDTTGATLLVAHLAYYTPTSTTPTISDSKGNTWTELAHNASASGIGGRMFWCVPSSVGGSHTFSSETISNLFPCIAVVAFSGGHASPFDDDTAGNGTGSTIQPGSITPAEDNEVLVTGVSVGAAGTVSVDSGFTEPNAEASGAAFQVSIAYKIQTSAAAVNPTWTIPSGGYGSVATMAAFKAAAAAGPPPVKRMMTGGLLSLSGGLA